MKSRLIVSAIIERNNKLLFGRKKENKGPYPNTWHLLGGGVHPEEESLAEAIRREIKEEAGIEVGTLEPISFDEDVESDKNNEPTRYVFLVFKTKWVSGEITPNDDIVKLEWIPKENLKKIELSRPSIKLFKKLKLL